MKSPKAADIVRAEEHIDDKNQKLLLFCAGYGGKTKQFASLLKAAKSKGYDVLMVEYDNTVLLSGDPNTLVKVVDYIEKLFVQKYKQKKYKYSVTCGVSLGSAIAFNIQRRQKTVNYGIYGCGGANVARFVYKLKYVTKPTRDKFLKNGIDMSKLESSWRHLLSYKSDILPKHVNFYMALGRSDGIVKHSLAVELFEYWKSQGVGVVVESKRLKNHRFTIRWYNRNFGSILTDAEMAFTN